MPNCQNSQEKKCTTQELGSLEDALRQSEYLISVIVSEIANIIDLNHYLYKSVRQSLEDESLVTEDLEKNFKEHEELHAESKKLVEKIRLQIESQKGETVQTEAITLERFLEMNNSLNKIIALLVEGEEAVLARKDEFMEEFNNLL